MEKVRLNTPFLSPSIEVHASAYLFAQISHLRQQLLRASVSATRATVVTCALDTKQAQGCGRGNTSLKIDRHKEQAGPLKYSKSPLFPPSVLETHEKDLTCEEEVEALERSVTQDPDPCINQRPSFSVVRIWEVVLQALQTQVRLIHHH